MKHVAALSDHHHHAPPPSPSSPSSSPSQRVFYLRSSSSMVDLRGIHSQVGSLAGAAHLQNYNAGVPRWAHREHKSPVDQKGKSSLDFDFQYEYKQ